MVMMNVKKALDPLEELAERFSWSEEEWKKAYAEHMERYQKWSEKAGIALHAKSLEHYRQNSLNDKEKQSLWPRGYREKIGTLLHSRETSLQVVSGYLLRLLAREKEKPLFPLHISDDVKTRVASLIHEAVEVSKESAE